MIKFFLHFILFITCIQGLSQKDSVIYDVDTTFQQASAMSGTINSFSWSSEYLNEARSITVYSPQIKNSELELGVLIVMDGIAEPLAKYVDYLISKEAIDPILIVGINPRPR